MLDNPNAAVMRDSAVSDAATRILSAGALRCARSLSVCQLVSTTKHLRSCRMMQCMDGVCLIGSCRSMSAVSCTVEPTTEGHQTWTFRQFCTRRFGQLESVTNQLFNLLNKHEHLAGPVAALAAQPALRGDDSRLVGHPYRSCDLHRLQVAFPESRSARRSLAALSYLALSHI